MFTKYQNRVFRKLTIPFALFLFLFFESLWEPSDLAFGKSSREYIIKASFIYNFTKFIDWPEEKSVSKNTFSLCIVGDDPFGNFLEQIAEKKRVKKKALEIKRFDEGGIVSGCEIIFLSLSAKPFASDVIQSNQGKSTLTIADSGGFNSKEIGIYFIVQSDTVRFHINKKVLDQADLKISSDLLDLSIAE